MMKKVYTFVILSFFFLGIVNITIAQIDKNVDKQTQREQLNQFLNNRLKNHSLISYKDDNPKLRIEHDFLMTFDPVLGYVPQERKFKALKEAKIRLKQGKNPIPGATWTERGPDNIGGRTRALMFDPNDATHKKVWAGSVGGGLWYNNDITNSSSPWTRVNDFWSNIATTCIASDPTNSQIFYVGTGEGFYNADAIMGAGIWKTTDGGTTWAQLPSTDPGQYPSGSNFTNINDIIVNSSGDIFAISKGYYIDRGGVLKSTDGGATWNVILSPYNGIGVPTNTSIYDRGTDLELAPNGDIYAAIGLFSTGKLYKTTNNGASWTDVTPATGGKRIEVAIAPSNSSIIYAFADDGTGSDSDIAWFKKSTNGGSSWSNVAIPQMIDGSGNDFSRGQGWYSVIMQVHPTDPNLVIVGGIDLHRTTNGGTSWSGISHWYGGYGEPEVHADQHSMAFRPNANNEVIFGNDGGVFYSSNAGNSGINPSFTNMDIGYNVTQFYSCAMKNTAGSNYFLAGAQDNGSHKFTSAGINSTTEVTGGDGAFCFIDQDNPTYQITSYVRNNWYRSTNGGSSFSSITSSSSGRFINPADYDNDADILYTAAGNDQLYRISGITSTYSASTRNVPLGGADASAIIASPYSANILFVGTDDGQIFKITNASGTPTSTDIDGSNILPVAYISCIEIGADDNNLLVTFSSYGVNHVWETVDGGGTWVDRTGNLPDMPVRFALYNPNDRKQVLLATEVGIWSTTDITIASPDWDPTNTGLANVRCDMLQYRPSDDLVAVATHGRGLYTSDCFVVPVCTPPTPQASNISFSGITNNAITINWTQGNGDADIVVVRETSAVNQDPTSGTTYTADNSVPFTGSEIGTGNYVVYDGSAGTTTVTGLTAGTTYHFAIYTYNSVDHCYNVTELTGNTTTLGPPSITTDVTSTITGSSATSGGNVTSNNGSAVTARGVCWNTSGGATIADSKTTDGSGTGAFVSSITGLSAVTTYYVRAYATNGYGTSYGNEEVFTTSCGTISSFPFTEGFETGALPNCWSNEYVTDTQDWAYQAGGNGGNPAAAHTGSFNAYFYNGSSTANVTKLVTPQLDFTSASTASLSFWHTQALWSSDQDELRIYYKNSAAGTWNLLATYTNDIPAWTEETVVLPNLTNDYYIAFEATGQYGRGVCLDDINVSIASAGTAPTVTTQAVTSISCTTATGNGNITNLGSPNPTAHGVCWNTTGAPTTSDSFTDEGGTSSTGTFTTAMTGLTANTTYYVRAYATNTIGTSYGTEVNFTTYPNLAVSVSIAADNNPVCEGTNVTFTATPTNGGTPSYQWKLNGTNVGSNSSTYSNSSLSDGDDITCVMTSSETCTTGNPTTSNTVTMNINPQPVAPTSVSASPTSVSSGGSSTLSYSGGSGDTFEWYTGSCGGTSIGSGNNLNVTNITSTTTYYGRWENGCGVSSCQQVTVTVSAASTYTISGTVKYNNGSASAINGETVQLLDNTSTVIATTTTDASGAYSFANIADGDYTVTPTGTYAWGGATAMDVTLYQQDILNEITLTGLEWTSGDVDGNAAINTLDLTKDLQKIVNPSGVFFSVGNWAYTNGAVSVNGANETVNLQSICYGDANVSYFGAKSLQTISVEKNSTIYVEDGDYFELQINLQNNLTNLSSVTLNIPYDINKFEITVVTMENNNSIYYNASNGVLRIAYSTTNTNNFVEGDKFLKIKGFVNNVIEETEISNNITGEFGDYNNNVLNNITFAIPSFSPKANNIYGIDKTIYIYPNPANNYLNILNAENSKIEVLNILGSNVIISQKLDKNKNRISTKHLSAGPYILKIYKDKKVIMKKFTIIK